VIAVLALAAAAQAVAALPTDAAGWQALGLKYAQTSDYELAEPALAEACRMEPRRSDACYQLGRVRYLLNRFAGAIGPLEQSLANPGEPAGRTTLALAQAREGLDEPLLAEPLYRKAVELGAADAEFRYAMFLLRQGRVDESARMARKAVERMPRSAMAFAELARAENQLDQLDSARQHLEQALALAPNYGPAHLLAGHVYQRLGQAEKAARHLKAASASKAAGTTPAPVRP